MKRFAKMESIRFLLRKFDEAAKEFPGTTHVIMKWPKGSPKPPLPTGLPKHCELAYDKDNLCEVHITPPDNYQNVLPCSDAPPEKVDVDISHWTIRPRDKSWDRKAAIRRLKILSEDAGRIYEELKVPPISSVQGIGMPIVPFFLSERWLLALHELRKPDILEGDILKAYYTEATGEQYPKIYPFLPWCSVIRDVFLESALECSRLLEQEGGTKTERDIAIGFMSAADLAKHYGVDTEALRKRLDRHREKHTLDTNLFIESQDRGKSKPKYLYNAEMVLHIIEELKSKEASIKRPSEKK